MVRVWGENFTCDECPICEGVEHRLRVAEEGGYEPQLEYCGCDKVQTEFFISGYCDDAFQEDVAPAKSHKPRKTGRAYRRQMRKQKKDMAEYISGRRRCPATRSLVVWSISSPVRR